MSNQSEPPEVPRTVSIVMGPAVIKCPDECTQQFGFVECRCSVTKSLLLTALTLFCRHNPTIHSVFSLAAIGVVDEQQDWIGKKRNQGDSEMKTRKDNERGFAHWGMLIVFGVAIAMVFATSMPLAMAGKPEKPPSMNPFDVYTIDSRGDVGHYTRIALDPDGNVHMTYYDATNYGLKYATNAGGSWKVQTIDVIGSRYGSPTWGADIAVDSQRDVHIIYSDMNHNLKYTGTAGNWVPQILASEVWGQFSLAVDKQDKLHISYWEDSNPNLPCIKYVYGSAGAWTYETVATDPNLSWSTSLALDSKGATHIVYLNLADFRLRYTNSTSNWDPQILDSTVFVAPRPCIAIDPANNIHLCYFTHDGQVRQQMLRYADNVGGTWTYKTIDSSADSYGHWSAIAVDSNSNVHISYSDYASGSSKPILNYATNTGGTWQIKMVDTSQNVGLENDIVVDSSFHVHISYLNSGQNDLKYAKSI